MKKQSAVSKYYDIIGDEQMGKDRKEVDKKIEKARKFIEQKLVFHTVMVIEQAAELNVLNKMKKAAKRKKDTEAIKELNLLLKKADDKQFLHVSSTTAHTEELNQLVYSNQVFVEK